MPEPKRGQPEYDLFRELTGKDWDAYADLEFDPETKITEFDYENYIPTDILQNYDTSTDEFRDVIRTLNLFTKTQIEQSELDKENFRNLMPVLACLPDCDKRSLIHLIKNER